MMTRDHFVNFGLKCGLAVAASACLLVSCGNEDKAAGVKAADKAPVPDAAVKAVEPVKVAAPVVPSASRVFSDRAVLELADLLRPYTQTPEIHESVRLLNELTENYWNDLKKNPAPTEEESILICRVGTKVGDMQAALQALDKAEATYREVLKHVAKLPADKVDAVRLRSGAMRGISVIQYAKDDAKASLEGFRACVDDDKKAMEMLKPSADAPQSAAYHAAAKDLMDSYKNVADVLVSMEELEDARDMYQKAVDLALSLKDLARQDEVVMRLKLMHTISSLGDLEEKCDQLAKAKTYWLEAATQCQSVYQTTTRPDLKSNASQAFDKLKTRILEAEKKLKGDKPEGGESSSDGMNVDDAPAPSASPAASGV